MSLSPPAALVRRLRVSLLSLVVSLPLALPRPAQGAPESVPEALPAKPTRANAPARRALFALVVGVNRNPERDQPPLHYADDDAARYRDLFRSLGARTRLLSTLDENTRAVHPQAVAEARPARRDELRRAVAGLSAEIRQARAAGARTVFYFVYAGHGDDERDRPALTLDDGNLGADELVPQVVTPVGADDAHVIIDACHAYQFALPRGPGGVRRPTSGFVDRVTRLSGDPDGRVGFLLASSINGDSHEWSGFEAGVFSHEVRSGLYGAADANGDGVVSYDEMGAFVTRANASITSEKYRPQIITRAPAGGDTLLDLRAQRRELVFAGKESAGHFLLEDAQGLRVADFHAAGSIPVMLIRPSEGVIYVRRLPSEEERVIREPAGTLGVLELPVEPPRSKPRGAAAHAFAQTFAYPFDEASVAAYDQRRLAEEADARREITRERARTVGTVALAASALSLAVAGSFALTARNAANEVPADANQMQIVTINETIRSRNRWATGALIGAGVTALVGAVLFWRF